MSSEAPAMVTPPPVSERPLLPGAPPLPDPQRSGRQVAVPPLEPPAPLTARCGPRATRQRVWRERGRELPSWLTSLILHVAITVVVASLAVPVTPRGNAVIALELTALAEEEVLEEPSAMVIAPVATSLPAEVADADNASLDPDELLVEVAETLRVDFEKAKAVRVEPGPQADDLQADSTDALPTLVKAVVEPSLSDPTSTDPPEPLVAARQGTDLGELIPASEPQDLDEIVARFIQYDIGELRGQAGSRARQRFMQLGPEAIPALVRGLNQSAYIRASCPVGVISRKLTEAMSQTEERLMIDYALHNIGRGVPLRAPHRKRIDSLRDSFARQYPDYQFLDDLPKINPVRSEPREVWVERVKRLYRAEAEELATSLGAVQPEERAAAWAALEMRPRADFTPDERQRLAALILNLWPRHSESYRRRMHDALASLAVGSGVAARTPRFRRQQSTRTWQSWNAWWNEHGDVDREEAAANLLRLAENADERDAQRLFARTIEKFPDTQTAVTARHMLSTAAKLKLAGTLEEQGRWTEAIGLYEAVAEATDFSPEAMQAYEAIDRLEMSGGSGRAGE